MTCFSTYRIAKSVGSAVGQSQPINKKLVGLIFPVLLAGCVSAEPSFELASGPQLDLQATPVQNVVNAPSGQVLASGDVAASPSPGTGIPVAAPRTVQTPSAALAIADPNQSGSAAQQVIETAAVPASVEAQPSSALTQTETTATKPSTETPQSTTTETASLETPQVETPEVIQEEQAQPTGLAALFAPRKNTSASRTNGNGGNSISRRRNRDDTGVRIKTAHRTSKTNTTLAAIAPSSAAATATPSNPSTPVPANPVNTARTSSTGLPGVKSNSEIFGIDDEPEADGFDVTTQNGARLASAAGFGILSPNGLRVQHDKVQVQCLKPGVLRILKIVEQRYGKKPIITSGYRSPKRNRRAGGAKNSQHIFCKAVDIQVEGVTKWDLAAYLRTIPGRGGVGTYCRTKSVHLDIGSKRDWHHPCRRSSKRKKKA